MASSETNEMRSFLTGFIDKLKKGTPDGLSGMLEPIFVDCSFEESMMKVIFNVQPWMRNPIGILHGGITATMLDNAMGTLVRYFAPMHGFAPTINLNVDYIKSVPINASVTVTAWVISEGNALIRTRAEAKISGTTEICAAASATYYCGQA